MAEQKEKVVFIVNTPSLERVSFGLNLASAAAALGKEVHILFGFGGLLRLKKDFINEVGEETTKYIREQINSALQKGGISKISELLKDIRRLEGKVYACPAAMAVHNLLREDLIDELDGVRGVVEFTRDNMKGASTVLYI